MNAVEIEEAISALTAEPFDSDEFPFAFLEALGNKTTTIKRLRSGSSSKSDVDGVPQTNNIHIKVGPLGEVTSILSDLNEGPARHDIHITDRFGNPVVPRECFLVPLFVIDEAVEKIKDRTVQGYVDVPSAEAIVRQS